MVSLKRSKSEIMEYLKFQKLKLILGENTLIFKRKGGSLANDSNKGVEYGKGIDRVHASLRNKSSV